MGPQANTIAFTGYLPTYLPTCLICSLLFTLPTNVSDIGLNGGGYPSQGKYPSHYQVYNAVRMIHITAWVHRLMLSHSQATYLPTYLPTNVSDLLPTIHVNYQRVSYRSKWGWISVSFPGMAPYYSPHPPTCLISV